MSDKVIDVGLRYKIVEFDQFKADSNKALEIMKQFGTGAAAAMGGMATGAASGAKAFTQQLIADTDRVKALTKEQLALEKTVLSERLAASKASIAASNALAAASKAEMAAARTSHTQYVNNSRQRSDEDRKAAGERKRLISEGSTHYRTYSELEQQYSKVSTRNLIEDINKLVIEKRRAGDEMIKGATEQAKQEAAIRLKIDEQELKSFYILSKQREEVQKKGAGALIGQLGIGRGLTEIGGNSLGMLGGVAASLGGAYGITMGLKEFYTEGENALKVLSRMRIGFSQANVPLNELNHEVERANKFAEELGSRWNILPDRLRVISTETAQLGKNTGQANEQITMASAAIEKITESWGQGAISAEMFARIFNSGMKDPEAELAIGRLKLKMGDLANVLTSAKNPAEALRLTMEYLKPTFKGLDEEANSNIATSKRASIAYAEWKRSVGLLLMEGLSPLLAILNPLAKMLTENSGLVAGVTVAVGGTTFALGAYLIALKLAHDEEVKEVAGQIASTAAKWLGVPATDALTGATISFNLSLKGIAATLSTTIGGVALIGGLVAGFIALKDARIERETEKIHEFNKELAKGHDNAVETTKALDAMSVAHQHDNIQLDIARQRQEQLSISTKNHGYELEHLKQNTEGVTGATRDFTRALIDQNEALVLAAKDNADIAASKVEFYTKRLADPTVTGEKRKAFQHDLEAFTQYGKSMVKVYETEEKAKNAAYTRIGARDDSGGKSTKSAEAYQREEKVKAYADQTKDLVESLKNKREINKIDDEAELRELRYHLLNAGIEERKAYQDKVQEESKNFSHELAASRDNKQKQIALTITHNAKLKELADNEDEQYIKGSAEIQRRIDEILKKQTEALAKQTTEDLKNVKSITERNLYETLATMEENHAKGIGSERDYNRQVLTLKLTAAQQNLADAVFLNDGIAEADKAVYDAKHNLLVFNNADTKKQGDGLIAIQKEIDDKRIAMIGNVQQKEIALANITYERETKKLYELELTDKKLEAEYLAVITKERDDRIAKAREDGYKNSQSLILGIVDSGSKSMFDQIATNFFSPEEKRLMASQNAWDRWKGGVLTSITKLATEGATKVAAFMALSVLFPNSKAAKDGLPSFLGFGGGGDGATATPSAAALPTSMTAGTGSSGGKQGIPKFAADDPALWSMLSQVMGVQLDRYAEGTNDTGPTSRVAIIDPNEMILNKDAAAQYRTMLSLGVGGPVMPGSMGGAESGENIPYVFAPGGEKTKEQKQRAKNYVASTKRQTDIDPGRAAAENEKYNADYAESQKATPSWFENGVRYITDPINNTLKDLGETAKANSQGAQASWVSKEGEQQINKWATTAGSFGAGTVMPAMDLAMLPFRAIPGANKPIQQFGEGEGLDQTALGTGKVLSQALAGRGLESTFEEVTNAITAGISKNLLIAIPEITNKIAEGQFGTALAQGVIETGLGSLGGIGSHYFEHVKHMGTAAEVIRAGETGSAKALESYNVAQSIGDWTGLNQQQEETPNKEIGPGAGETASNEIDAKKENIDSHKQLAKTIDNTTKSMQIFGAATKMVSDKQLLGKDAHKALGLGSQVAGIGSAILSMIPGESEAMKIFSGLGSIFGIGGGLSTGGMISDDGIRGYASGGVHPINSSASVLNSIFHGPGSSTSDSILTRVSNGEGILTPGGVNVLGGPGVVHAANLGRNISNQGPALPPKISVNGPSYSSPSSTTQSPQINFTPLLGAINSLGDRIERIKIHLDGIELRQSGIRTERQQGEIALG